MLRVGKGAVALHAGIPMSDEESHSDFSIRSDRRTYEDVDEVQGRNNFDERDHERDQEHRTGANVPLTSTPMSLQAQLSRSSTRKNNVRQQGRDHLPDLSRRKNQHPTTKQPRIRLPENMDNDVTLSTQTESIMDDAHPQNDNLDRSLIPGVGHGHHRRSQPLHHSQLLKGIRGNPSHLSPFTAARHQRLQYSDLHADDSEDSESAVESSSVSGQSDVDDVAQHQSPFHRSIAESTGNHQGFMRTPQPFSKIKAPREQSEKAQRPVLPNGWQHGMDEAFGQIQTPSRLPPESPSVERAQRSRRQSPVEAAVESGSNKSGYAAGSQQNRKTSQASSGKQRKLSGTEADNASGETLVDQVDAEERAHNYASTSKSRLPSGHDLGKGHPSRYHEISNFARTERDRLDVGHSPSNPRYDIEAFPVPKVLLRDEEVARLQRHIFHVEQKVDRVESVSSGTRKELGALRKQLADWHKQDASPPEQDYSRKAFSPRLQKARVAKERVSMPQSDSPYEERSNVEEAQHYRSSIQNAKAELAELQQRYKIENRRLHALQEQEKQAREHEEKLKRSDARGAGAGSAQSAKEEDRKGALQQDVDTTDDLISLRVQVDAVAREVERLKLIVDQREQNKRVLSMSSPIKPAQWRSIGVGGANPFVQRRKVSGGSDQDNVKDQRNGYPRALPRKASEGRERNNFDKQQHELAVESEDERVNVGQDAELTEDDEKDAGESDEEEEDDDEGDETAMPEVRAPSKPASPDLNDVSVMADARAEQAYAKVVLETQDHAFDDFHDSSRCAQCRSKYDRECQRERRKVSGGQRKVKSRKSSSSFDEQEQEDAHALLEQALLDLENVLGARLPPSLLQLANKQRALLQQTIAEEMEDFYHARYTYCELADELKSFSPDMSVKKRSILAEHVMMSVESLEIRASRIDRLRAALAATLPDMASEGEEMAGHGAAVRVQQRQRQASTSTSQSDKRHRRPRNSPPMVDEDALHGRAHNRNVNRRNVHI